MSGCLSQHFSPGCTLGKERSIVTPPPPSLRSPQGTCAVTFFKLETGWGTRKPAFEGFLNSWFLNCCVWVILHEVTFGVYWSVTEGIWWGSIGAILESPRDVVLIPGTPRECFRKFPVDFHESSGLAFGVVVWEFRPFGSYMIIELPLHSFRRSPASFGPRPFLFTPYRLFRKYLVSNRCQDQPMLSRCAQCVGDVGPGQVMMEAWRSYQIHGGFSPSELHSVSAVQLGIMWRKVSQWNRMGDAGMWRLWSNLRIYDCFKPVRWTWRGGVCLRWVISSSRIQCGLGRL